MIRSPCPSLQPDRKQAGFTLVELSIVLVIIGLIVGGVLVGQDMIKAAEIRATVADFEAYNSGVNTFRSKYGSIPGDLSNARAMAFLALPTGNGGDNDGLLENTCTGTPPACATTAWNTLTAEFTWFWRHLSAARLVPGSYYDGTANVPTALPTTPLGKGHVSVFGWNGRNYLQLANLSTFGTPANILLPEEAFGIDNKMDDGLPTTGVVVAFGAAVITTGAFPAPAATCAAGTPSQYMIATEGPNCSLILRMN